MRPRHALAILAAVAVIPAWADAEPAGEAAAPAAPEPAGEAAAPAAPEPAGEAAAPVDRIAPAPAAPEPGPSTLRRIAAVGAAIVPGVLVRGAGSYVAGERRTATRLFAAGLVGFVTAAVAGGAAVGSTGAASQLIWPAAPLAVLGVGVFVPTWFADIWVAAGGERVRGGPRGTPPWSLELSAGVLRDPYRARALTGAAAGIELGPLGLGASALADAGGDQRTADLEVRWRIRGAAAGDGPIEDGSRLHVRAAARYHRDDPDDVSLATVELELVLRAELRRLDPRLAGTFLELSTGAGLERVTYAGGAHDLDSILLGRFAWGAYLGRRGEATLFYDHRRDDLAGGLFAAGASGFLGSVGAAAQVAVIGPWAVRGELEIGNAWVGTLAVRYHGGAR